MLPSTVVGSFVGTGAITNVVIGFQPDYVRIVDTTNGNLIEEWFRGMATKTSINDSGAAPATRAAPNGIDPYPLQPNAAIAGEGFTVSAALSVNGATMRYLAVRSGPGAS